MQLNLYTHDKICVFFLFVYVIAMFWFGKKTCGNTKIGHFNAHSFFKATWSETLNWYSFGKCVDIIDVNKIFGECVLNEIKKETYFNQNCFIQTDFGSTKHGDRHCGHCFFNLLSDVIKHNRQNVCPQLVDIGSHNN